MENKIIYSVIIPHYNSIDKLNRLILSIPEREDLEILVVDDKSLDFDLTKINKRYNLKILINQTNKKGAGVCRNIGMDNSSGKWLIFADADDYFINEWFDEISKYKESEYEIIYFVPTSIYEDTLNIAMRHIPYENMLLKFLEKQTFEKKERLKYNFIVPWSKMIKKDLCEVNNLKFEEVLASNDVMFSIKTAYYAKNIKVSEKKIYCVTTSEGTLTQKLNKDILESRLFVSIRANNFLKEKKLNDYARSLLPYVIKSINFEWRYFFKILKICLINGINISKFFEKYIKDIGIKNILEFQLKDRKYYIKEKD